MLSVAIAVEPPTEAAAAVAEAVVQSCQQAIGPERCRAARDLDAASVVPWVAVVRLPEAPASDLSIEFHDRVPQGALLETRTLAFSPHDSERSRWASAGAVIAAFVAARVPSEAPALPSAPPPAPPQPQEPPAPAAPSGLLWNLDLALFSGPGLDRGAYRLGALGRGYVGLLQAPGVLGLASVRYAERPGDLAIGWWSVGCGLGARVGRDSLLSAELTGELAFERMNLHARDGMLGQDSAAQNRFGGRLSLNIALELTRILSLVAGAEANALRPSVSVVVADDVTGREPAVGFAFSAGVRLGGGK